MSETNTENEPLNLLSLMEDTKELRTKIEYKHGIVFELRYIPKTVLQQISRESTIWKYNEQTKQRQPELEAKRLVPKLCEKCVVGWEGVTVRSLAKIVPLDLSQVPASKLDTPIPFSQAQMSAIADKAYGLDVFIQEAATELTNFSQDPVQHEEELKN